MLETDSGIVINWAYWEFQIPDKTLKNHMEMGLTEKKLRKSSQLTPNRENELGESMFRLEMLICLLDQK